MCNDLVGNQSDRLPSACLPDLELDIMTPTRPKVWGLIDGFVIRGDLVCVASDNTTALVVELKMMHKARSGNYSTSTQIVDLFIEYTHQPTMHVAH